MPRTSRPHRAAAIVFVTTLLAWLTPLRADEGSQPNGTSAAAGDTDQLLREAGEIARQVAEIRGLGLLEDFRRGIKNREELREALDRKIAENVREEDIVQEGKVYERLGILAPGTDYRQLMLEVLAEQIAGFYDPKQKELYIMQGVPRDMQRPAMAHEIFHAIQDQHYGIEKLLEPWSSLENGDHALARLALIEGDATLVMVDYVLHEQKALPQGKVRSVAGIPLARALLMNLDFDALGPLEQMLAMGEAPGGVPKDVAAAASALSRAPDYLRQLLVFPYFGGLRFLLQTADPSDPESFDRLYRTPPLSTEHILHPSRYLAGDEPVMVSFSPELVLPGYRRIYDTVLGELQMQLWHRHHMAEGAPQAAERITRATEGWGGDRLQVFQSPEGQILAAHLSSWDSLQDATEYYEAMIAMAQKRYPQANVSQQQGRHGQSVCLQRDPAKFGGGAMGPERVYIERWGELVLYVEGSPSRLDAKGRETDPTTWQVREEIWRTLRRETYARALQARTAEQEKTRSAPASPVPSPAPPTP